MNVGKALITAVLVVSGSLAAGATDQTKSVTMGAMPRPLPKQIEAQGCIIYIKARDGQPTRFTVKTKKDGKVLAKNATLDELQRQDAILAHFVRRSLAANRAAVQQSPPLPVVSRRQ